MGQSAPILAENNITFDSTNMLNLLRKISGILEEEVGLLQQMKIAAIHKFNADKMAIISILETYKQLLAQNPDLINTIPDRVRAQLREEATRFERLSEEDGRLLVRAGEVHKLVMEALKRALDKRVAMNSGYTKQGIVSPGKSATFITPSVSLNENI